MPQLPLSFGGFLFVLWKTHQYDATPVAALAQDSSLLGDWDQVAAGGVDIPKNSNSRSFSLGLADGKLF